MGQNAKRKRERASQAASTVPESAGDPRAGGVARSHHLRMILLGAIPVLSVGGAIALVQLLDSRPGAGMVLILGCAVWITIFASDVGGSIPRRDRTRSSGLSFGRKS